MSWAGLGLVLAAVLCETAFLLLRKALREPLSALALGEPLLPAPAAGCAAVAAGIALISLRRRSGA